MFDAVPFDAHFHQYEFGVFGGLGRTGGFDRRAVELDRAAHQLEVRTAVGTARKGTLANTPPEVLAAAVIRAAVERSGFAPEMIDDIVQGLSLKRRGTPEDLVGMCLFLLSDEAAWITGQVVNVDGGQIMRP